MTTAAIHTDELVPSGPPVRASWTSGWQTATALAGFELLLILCRSLTGRGEFNQLQIIDSIGAGRAAFGTILNPNVVTAMIWAAATVLVLFVAIRQLSRETLVAGTLVLVFVVSPLAWDSFRPGSPFATSVLVGTILFVLTRAAVEGRCSAFWLLPISAAAVLINTTHLIGVIATALYAGASMLPWLRPVSSPSRRSSAFSFAGLSIGAFLALAIVKLAFRAGAPLGAAVPTDTLSRLKQAAIALQGSLLSQTSTSETSLDYPLSSLVTIPLAWVCIAGIAAATAWYLTDRRWASMTQGLLLAAVVAAPITASILSRLSGAHYGISGMAAATLVPMFLLVSALVARNRLVNLVILAYSCALGLSLLLWSAVPA